MPASSLPVIVIDAGIALYRVTPTPFTEQATHVWAQWQEDDAEIYAPTLWRYEVTSILHKLFHLGQLTEAEAVTALEKVLAFGVQTIDMGDDLCSQSFGWATRLGTAAAYDAFYLTLAERLGAELWTGDKRLANNAHSKGVAWIHWIGGM